MRTPFLTAGTVIRLATAMLVMAGMFLVGTAQSRAADGPDPFYGVGSQNPMSAEAFDTMEWGRIGSYRVPVAWGSVESADGERDWSHIDKIVANTARRGINLLPTLYLAPTWLAPDRRRLPIWGPYPIRRWQSFVRAAVLRYGADGTFWTDHPEIPVRAVDEWQIWNEPNIKYFAWPVSPRRYAKLVKISSRVIRNYDPDAKVVLAGLYSSVPPNKGMDAGPFLNRAYGVRDFRYSFDVAAIHPYAGTTRESIQRTFPVRRVLNRHGNRGRKLAITEIGWGSDSATIFGKGNQLDQGIQLTSAYRAFLRQSKALNLSAIYWFAWDDLPAGTKSCAFCIETGLFDNQGQPKTAWYRLLDFTHDR